MSWNSLICFNIPRDREYEAYFRSLILNHIFFSKVFLNYGFGGFFYALALVFFFFFKHHIFYFRFSLVTYFIHNRVYMSIPISQFILPPLLSLVTINLFSIPVTYFCSANKFIHITSFYILPISNIIQYLFSSF